MSERLCPILLFFLEKTNYSLCVCTRFMKNILIGFLFLHQNSVFAFPSCDEYGERRMDALQSYILLGINKAQREGKKDKARSKQNGRTRGKAMGNEDNDV